MALDVEETRHSNLKPVRQALYGTVQQHNVLLPRMVRQNPAGCLWLRSAFFLHN